MVCAILCTKARGVASCIAANFNGLSLTQILVTVTKRKKFEVKAEKFEMEDKFMFTYDDSSCIAILDQATAFSTFYTSDGIYSMAGKEFCIALDVALAMSGSEAVVE